MSVVEPGSEHPEDATATAEGAERKPKRLSFTSVPVLMTSIVLSATLLIGAMWWWGALGKEIRDQVPTSQAVVWIVLVALMLFIMLSLGYSKVWADDEGVTVRNGPIVKRYAVADIAGLRLRKHDPWAYLLIKREGGVKPAAMLAIQAIEGDNGRRKLNALRDWLKERGATSRDVDPTSLT